MQATYLVYGYYGKTDRQMEDVIFQCDWKAEDDSTSLKSDSPRSWELLSLRASGDKWSHTVDVKPTEIYLVNKQPAFLV